MHTSVDGRILSFLFAQGFSLAVACKSELFIGITCVLSRFAIIIIVELWWKGSYVT